MYTEVRSKQVWQADNDAFIVFLICYRRMDPRTDRETDWQYIILNVRGPQKCFVMFCKTHLFESPKKLHLKILFVDTETRLYGIWLTGKSPHDRDQKGAQLRKNCQWKLLRNYGRCNISLADPLHLIYMWCVLALIWSDFPHFGYFSTTGTDGRTDGPTDG